MRDDACHLVTCPACGTTLWDLEGLEAEALTQLAMIFRDHLCEHGWSHTRMLQWTQDALVRHEGEPS